MHTTTDSKLVLTATDLSRFLGCPQLTQLDRAVAVGQIGKPPRWDDPGLEAVRKRGAQHEQAYLARAKARGGSVFELREPGPDLAEAERWQHLARETENAMKAGADVIYQACLFDGTWLGRPDFLERVERPSALRAWSYEVVDTKLAREAKGGALLQVLLYAELLARVQGRPPEFVHLALGGPEPRTESFRVTEYSAYFRSVRRRFLDALADSRAKLAVAPEPVAHCELCAWRTRCDRERHQVDHLSLVAGIRRGERQALVGRGVETVNALAGMAIPPVPRLDGVSDAALTRVREQARVQVEGRQAGRPVHELIEPIEAGFGLGLLPPPSAGDLFFDLEGDPYALGHGIEYLFGFVDRSGESTSWWAFDRASEKGVFERFIDFVIARLDVYPDMHIYHYAPYEPSAMKRLMGMHATREEDVDRLLRGKRFVDLYRVVRQGVRASVESYSIKKLEPFYGYTRDVDLRSASSALANFEAWLELGGEESGDDALLSAIEGYNRDDCVSTLRLAEWLESQRDELERKTGRTLPRPQPADAEPSENVAEEQGVVAQLIADLVAGVPADPAEQDDEQHGRWLLAHLLGFHRREDKSMWWEYYRRMALSDEELIEDRATIGGLTYESVVETVKRSHVHRYRFPSQDHDIRADTVVRDPATDKTPGAVVNVDDDACAIDIRRGIASQVPHPAALVPFEYVNDIVLRQSLQRIAGSVIDHGFGEDNPHRPAVELLLRRPPCVRQSNEIGPVLDADRSSDIGGSADIGRSSDLGGSSTDERPADSRRAVGASLMEPGETTLDAGRRLVTRLDHSVLPIQGPPGAGKTYTAAHMIVEAVKAGMRVGITATSHKVISNLLDRTCRVARELGVAVRGIQRANREQACSSEEVAFASDNADVLSALDEGDANVAAGTAWLWSREEMAGAVDLLFVDEAGQFSLANALAVAPAASSLVLVGDPRQLQQPQKGVHPPGVEVSALEHLLGDAATMPPDRGLFLDRTWRLNPDLCAFTSELFYDGRLEPIDGLESRRIIAPSSPLEGSGLRLVHVDHEGRQSECPEEVEVVAALIERALDGGQWVDESGTTYALMPGDILVVAPYNAQVGALREGLPKGVRVGTVDKFQGQEAPVVIYSMATSSAEDAPRGMDFLYDLHRLNVATSRAQCVAVVVASPRLFTPDCRTPAQMRLANGVCAVAERAAGADPAVQSGEARFMARRSGEDCGSAVAMGARTRRGPGRT